MLSMTGARDQFKTHIYNDDYRIDRSGLRELSRPRVNAEIVARLCAAKHQTKDTRVLDYGGGNGALCAALRERGFPGGRNLRPDGSGILPAARTGNSTW